MSKLTELAALRMQVFALEHEKCAGCGHTLSAHAPTQAKPESCRAWDTIAGRVVYCVCKTFVDERSEQTELDA